MFNLITADGEDYIIASTIVSIAAEEMSKSFTINIINENIIECDETFKLTLNVPASTCGAVNGTNNRTEVTIKDDDSTISGSCCVQCFIHILINRSIIIHYTVTIFY